MRRFVSELTGCGEATIRVFGEELKSLAIPPEARYLGNRLISI